MANNLRKFATESEYNSATLNYPSVSWITGTDTVHFDKVSPIPKKLKLTYSDTSIYDIDCDTATTLTQSDIRGGSASYTAITSAEIGNCISSIGDDAFYGCSSLTSINIPSGVTSIGDRTFAECSNLTSIDIPNSVTSIGNSAFFQCSGLTSCTIGSGVTSIGDSVFYYCTNLTSIVIPNSVTSISSSAFRGCSSLTSIDLPNSVTSIGAYSFWGCSSLTSIEIPSGVTSIGFNAFQNCSSLTSVTVNATTPPTLGTSAFDGSTCPIYVPAASVEAYKNSGYWSDYASRIQAIIE